MLSRTLLKQFLICNCEFTNFDFDNFFQRVRQMSCRLSQLMLRSFMGEFFKRFLPVSARMDCIIFDFKNLKA